MSTVYLNTVSFKSGMPEYHLASRQIVKRSQQIYQASKRDKNYGVVNTLTSKQWLIVLIKSKGECFYCQKDVGAENLGIEIHTEMNADLLSYISKQVKSFFIKTTKLNCNL